ncbi:MAG: head-tail adaptor protein [Pseudorhodoplanes sp.]|jgi:head-tail adaptor|nr:head-tail adaptor protein [Pseudorhodoplanes sp.]
MDRIISVLRPTIVGRDDFNEPRYEWLPVHRVWAGKKQNSEAERFDEHTKERYGFSAVTFKTRYIAVYVTDRVICEGTQYDVKGVREIGRREGVEIVCEAQT